MPKTKEEIEAKKILCEIKKDVSYIEETVKTGSFQKAFKKESQENKE